MNQITVSEEGIVSVQMDGGYVTKVDFHTWEGMRLARFTWRAQVHKRGYVYAYASRGGSSVTMHRWIMCREKGQSVDHINRDTLDNRRANLRFATSAQNRANSGRERNNESGYKGVSWSDTSKKWTAKVCVKGERHYLGVYVDKVRAAMAVDRKALELQGAFAGLNFEHLRDTYRVSRG